MSRARMRTRGAAGFTLIEVMLALAMTVALAAAMLIFTVNVAETTARSGEKTDRSIHVDRLMHLLEEALETPVATDPTPEATGEGGIRCEGTSIRVLFRGVREGVTELSLRHDAPGRRIVGGVGERRGVGGATDAPGRPEEEFANGIARFRVRCIGADAGAGGGGRVAPGDGASSGAGGDAIEAFDSGSDGLPSAVVVEVWFAEGSAAGGAETSSSGPDRPADRTRWIRVIGGGR